MLCRICDILTEVPEAGGLAPRCRAYRWETQDLPDLIIREELYHGDKYPDSQDPEFIAYMESASQFYTGLIHFGGLYLHASAVAYEGRAYLFSGDSGVGKSTHTRLWQREFGEAAQVFNDDKPALRRMDGVWYAYGTPWCGKDGINQNKKVPLAGICFLKQGQHNSIRRLSAREALQSIMAQTIHRFRYAQNLDKMLTLMENLIREIPVYELTNRPEPEAALLSRDTMRMGAEEAGL